MADSGIKTSLVVCVCVCGGGGALTACVDKFGVESEKSGRVATGSRWGKWGGGTRGPGLEGEGSWISTKGGGLLLLLLLLLLVVVEVVVMVVVGGGGGGGVATGLWVKPDEGHHSVEMWRHDQEHCALIREGLRSRVEHGGEGR